MRYRLTDSVYMMARSRGQDENGKVNLGVGISSLL